MKNIDHPNISKLVEVIDDTESGKLYFIMDYFKNGQIMDWTFEDRKFRPNPVLF